MLMIMVLFFGVIIAVNITMAVMAGRSWTGLVVKNSYVASQHFNSQLVEAERQRARGWKSQLGYVAGQVSFELRDKNNQPIILDDLKVSLGRPASEQQDRTLALRHVGDGKYQAAVQLSRGHWAAQITGGSGDMAYRRDARLFVKKAQAADQDAGKVQRQ